MEFFSTQEEEEEEEVYKMMGENIAFDVKRVLIFSVTSCGVLLHTRRRRRRRRRI